MAAGLWGILAVVVWLGVVSGADPHQCNHMVDQWPPAANRSLPAFTVDLDKPPRERWAHVVKPYSAGILKLIHEILNLFPKDLRELLTKLLDVAILADFLGRIPKEYAGEMEGIAEATGIDLGLIAAYNLAYDFSTLCTSIVAQNKDGHVYHGRNLDFSLGPELRPLMVNARMVRGGVNVWNGTFYAGYIGCLTCMKQGGFSLTVDTRFGIPFEYIFEWFAHRWHGEFVSFATRNAMEHNATFTDAVQALSTVELNSPVYIILSGVKEGEGAVITRAEPRAVDVWTLQSRLNNGSFYVLETNYDHWKEVPASDDRRYPGMACMDQVGPYDIAFPGLWNVLSHPPNLNDGTTYTTLIDVKRGIHEAFIQDTTKQS